MPTTTSGQGLTATGPPGLPSWLGIVRIIIMVFSLAAAIAAAYLISLYSDTNTRLFFSGYTGPGGFIVFDAIFTWIILGIMLISEYWAPRIYMRSAFLGTLILAIILWAGAWGWTSSTLANFYNLYGNANYSKDTWAKKFVASSTATAALGGTTWVFLVIFVIFFARACMAAPQGTSFSK